MARHRVFVVFSIFFLMFVALSFSSPIFCLKGAEVVFVENNNIKALTHNSTFLNRTSIENNANCLIKDDIGKSIFVVDKDKYFSQFESQNTYAKLVKIESKYPNTLTFYVAERSPLAIIKNTQVNGFLLVDSEFKIVEKKNVSDNAYANNLINLVATDSYGREQSFFSFFEIDFDIFSAGMNLQENNNAIKAISNLFCISKDNLIVEDNNLLDYIDELCFFCDENKDFLNLKINTNKSLGVQLVVENIISEFDRKFDKIILALKTLYKRDRIKTTYGALKINDACNCFWNKL